jgi:hypothetical protein
MEAWAHILVAESKDPSDRCAGWVGSVYGSNYDLGFCFNPTFSEVESPVFDRTVMQTASTTGLMAEESLAEAYKAISSEVILPNSLNNRHRIERLGTSHSFPTQRCGTKLRARNCGSVGAQTY